MSEENKQRFAVNDKAQLYWEIVDTETNTVAYTLDKTGDKEEGDENRDEADIAAKAMNALAPDLARLQAIVEKLPKTKDGVAVILKATPLWWRDPLTGRIHEMGAPFAITYGENEAEPYALCHGWSARRLTDCYSTPEAAEKGSV